MEAIRDIDTRNAGQFNENELKFWTDYGITIAILTRHNTYALDNIPTWGARSKLSESESLRFGYQIDLSCYKVYQPLSNKGKFSWIGKKPTDYVFGFNQLPTIGDLLIITGGEKDVLTLISHGFNAICLNSETANFPDWLISTLKPRFKAVVILYDIDDTGTEQARKLSTAHQIPFVTLPNQIEGEEYGKDVSDFFKAGEPFAPPLEDLLADLIKVELEKFEVIKFKYPEELKKLIDTTEYLRQRKSTDIELIKAILMHGEESVLFPNSLMTIQGKAGSHKSRLAEVVVSALLAKTGRTTPDLGFHRVGDNDLTVCCIDTERNHSDQFPTALQRMLSVAGFQVFDNPENFLYTSLLDIPREKRLEVIGDYVQNIRTTISGSIIVVLDVLTDCLFNFNDPTESLKLIDMLNVFSNKLNVAFICVIHENPGISNKARGHLGTELLNKSTSVLQTSLVDYGDSNEEGVKIDFLKRRYSRRYYPVYAVFDESSQSLACASQTQIANFEQLKENKASIGEVIHYLGNNVIFPTELSSLKADLRQYFDVSQRTIDTRLKVIIENQKPINTDDGIMYLSKKKFGRTAMYVLAKCITD